jgi:hypothetical protein
MLPIRNRVAQADMTRDLLQQRAFQTQRYSCKIRLLSKSMPR